MRINKIADLVKKILEENVLARNSDRVLYFYILRAIDETALSMSTKDFLLHAENVPSFETVRRTRQKVQEQNPELRASDKVKEYRRENEKEYLQFARSYES